MKVLILSFLVFQSISLCAQSTKSTNNVPDFNQSQQKSMNISEPVKRFLQGEWVGNNQEVLAFSAAGATYLPRMGYTGYTVEKSKIIIAPKPKDLPDYKKPVIYQILKRKGTDSLWVKVLQHPYEPVGKKIIFVKTSIYRNRRWADFGKITFISHPCFGNCENYKFELSIDGTFTYEGIYKAEKMGKFSGSLNVFQMTDLTRMLCNGNPNLQPNQTDLPQDLYARTVTLEMLDGEIRVLHADNFSPEFNLFCFYVDFLVHSVEMKPLN
jgi:hypothetical protein